MCTDKLFYLSIQLIPQLNCIPQNIVTQWYTIHRVRLSLRLILSGPTSEIHWALERVSKSWWYPHQKSNKRDGSNNRHSLQNYLCYQQTQFCPHLITKSNCPLAPTFERAAYTSQVSLEYFQKCKLDIIYWRC